jgi:hypothetical protein
MEAVHSSEMVVNSYQTTWSQNTEESTLRQISLVTCCGTTDKLILSSSLWIQVAFLKLSFRVLEKERFQVKYDPKFNLYEHVMD